MKFTKVKGGGGYITAENTDEAYTLGMIDGVALAKGSPT